MKFAILTAPETTGLQVAWGDSSPKTPHIVSAALDAGFSLQEIEESPLGKVQVDFAISRTEIAKTGMIVLSGSNGAVLLQFE